MSNARSPRRRLSTAQADVAAVLGPLDGSAIPGGCDHCDAYQTTRPVAAGVWALTVRHDGGCPVLAASRTHRSDQDPAP